MSGISELRCEGQRGDYPRQSKGPVVDTHMCLGDCGEAGVAEGEGSVAGTGRAVQTARHLLVGTGVLRSECGFSCP